MYVRQFIKKLDRVSTVANNLGFSVQYLSRWYKTGIPANKLDEMVKYAEKKGLNYTKKFISELETE
jgi:hypothetical protein